MADRIDTVESRSKLKPRTAPYWQKVSGGCALGFRKMTKQSDGSWLAQFYDSSTKNKLGKVLDHLASYNRISDLIRQRKRRSYFSNT